MGWTAAQHDLPYLWVISGWFLLFGFEGYRFLLMTKRSPSSLLTMFWMGLTAVV